MRAHPHFIVLVICFCSRHRHISLENQLLICFCSLLEEVSCLQKYFKKSIKIKKN